MKIRITFDISDEMRKAINAHYGRPGKATQAECASAIKGLTWADLHVVLSDYNQEQKERATQDRT